MTDPNGSKLTVIDRRAPETLPAAREITPMDLLRIATSQGADLDKLEKLMELNRAYEADLARKAFHLAMSEFHKDPPEIKKNKHVRFDTSSGGMDYWHATHDEVSGKIGAALALHGLSHSWRMRQEDGGIYVTCRITHRLGHFEELELHGPADTSGKKSQLQAVASTITFLQRYTLLALSGLSTSELRAADDDARKLPQEPEPEGYATWKANVTAVADECEPPKLLAMWKAATPAQRRYVVKFDEAWWNHERDIADGKATRGEA